MSHQFEQCLSWSVVGCVFEKYLAWSLECCDEFVPMQCWTCINFLFLSCGSSETSSYNSESHDDEEIALAVQAAELANRNQARARFRSSSDMIHRLFVCISGESADIPWTHSKGCRYLFSTPPSPPTTLHFLSLWVVGLGCCPLDEMKMRSSVLQVLHTLTWTWRSNISNNSRKCSHGKFLLNSEWNWSSELNWIFVLFYFLLGSFLFYFPWG